MQLFKPISILASATLAIATQTRYQFFAKSDYYQVNGNGLTFINEGANIEYFLVQNDTSSTPVVLTYDDEQQQVFFSTGPQLKLNLTKEGYGYFLELTKGTALKTTIEDGVVSFDGSDGLHAVRGLTLPNTGDNYVVIVGGYEHGFPFTIEAKEYVG